MNVKKILLWLPFILNATTFSFGMIPSPQIAGDSFFVQINAYDPEDFNGFGIISVRPLPSYMEVIGASNNRVEFANGVWSGYVRIFRAADSVHLNCTEYGHSDINLSNVFSVLSNSPERLQILLPGEFSDPGNTAGSGRYGAPASIIAGRDTLAEIYLTDHWWNPVGSGNDEVYITCNNPFPILPFPASMDAGSLQVNYNLRTAQQNNYIYVHHNPAGVDTFISDTSSAFEVIPGDFSRLLLTVPGEVLLPGDTLQQPSATRYPGVDGEPSLQTAGVSFPVAVYAVDNCWNVVSTAPPDIVRIEAYRFPSLTQTGTLTNGIADFSIVPTIGGIVLVLWATDTTDISIENSYNVLVNVSGGSEELEELVVNFPNPFGRDNTYTTIHYYLNEDADVLLRIYDKFGNLVWVYEGQGQGGEEPNTVRWDGVTDDGERVASGIYFLCIRATNRTKTVAEYKRKIAVIR